MIFLLLILLILFYMFLAAIKTSKKSFDSIKYYLNCICYRELIQGLIEDNKKDRKEN